MTRLVEGGVEHELRLLLALQLEQLVRDEALAQRRAHAALARVVRGRAEPSQEHGALAPCPLAPGLPLVVSAHQPG